MACAVLSQLAISAGSQDGISKMPESAFMACRAKCTNNDGDELYPQGTFDRVCVERCRDSIVKSAPPSPGVRPSGNNRAFILLEPMTYQIGDTRASITVSAGFVTDYASIPRRLWILFSPHDQYSRAAIVHDWLYWSQLCTRAQADNLFMIAMKESKVCAAKRAIVYSAVHMLGQSAWDDNGKQRRQGLPRIVPITRQDFPPNWSWEKYQKYLLQEGVRDPQFQEAGYCEFGNTTDVPIMTARGAKSMPEPKLAVRALHEIDSPELLGGPNK